MIPKGLSARDLSVMFGLGNYGPVLIRKWAVDNPEIRVGRGHHRDGRAQMYDVLAVRDHVIEWQRGRDLVA